MGFSGGLARLARYTEGLACTSLYGMARLKGPRSYRGILRWVTPNGFPSRPRAEWSPEGSVLPREGQNGVRLQPAANIAHVARSQPNRP